MDAKVIAGDVIVLLIGLLLLIFNKQIGRFSEEKLANLYGTKIEKMISWFPRLNTIVIGLLFTIGGLYNLINYIINHSF